MVLKKFLLYSMAFITVAVVITVLVFLYIQHQFFSGARYSEIGAGPTSEETTKNDTGQSEVTKEETVASEPAAVVDVGSGGIPLRDIPLNDSQRAMLGQFNIDYDTFVITEKMIICAENKLGKDRFDEIINGSAPSFLESLSLFGCTK